MNIAAKPWIKKYPPKKILAIRLQATGDVIGTFPYLQYLLRSLPPSTTLDFLTREETEDISTNIILFNKTFIIGGGRNFKKQLLYVCLLLPKLFLRRYDIIIDLQNNFLSKVVRKSLLPKAWSVFDRFAPISGAERYRLTIEAVGLGKIKADNSFYFKHPDAAIKILKANGWHEDDELIVLNPAGAFETRNWSLDNYVAFARLWVSEFPQSKFLIVGTSSIASKAALMKEKLKDKLINLVGLTTTTEAFAILQHVKFVLSEDSGLMHMAWLSGIPTLAMFGSTRSDWSRPLGEHTFLLDSSDLPCGNCMLEVCKFGDVHCLTRYTPKQIFQHAVDLIKKVNEVHKQ